MSLLMYRFQKNVFIDTHEPAPCLEHFCVNECDCYCQKIEENLYGMSLSYIHNLILFPQRFHFMLKYRNWSHHFWQFSLYCLVWLNIFFDEMCLYVLYSCAWLQKLSSTPNLLFIKLAESVHLRKWNLWKLSTWNNKKLFTLRNHFHFPWKMLCPNYYFFERSLPKHTYRDFQG